MTVLAPPSPWASLPAKSMTTRLKPLPYLEQPAWLLTLTLVCIVLATLAILAAIFLPRILGVRGKNDKEGTHIKPKQIWQEEVNKVVTDQEQGRISRDEAMKELAGIARGFASQSWHQDMTTKTLAEITVQPRTTSTSKGLDLLRQTIDALYPPEFGLHGERHSGEQVSVDEAANWVMALIERWR